MSYLPARCPSESIVWRAWSGAVVLTVVCKATFRLRSVESPLADQQDPIVDADRYWYDDPREALRLPTDLVPYKRGAEVIVVGHAHAPHGAPVRSMMARVSVAGCDKIVEIFTDRVFSLEGRLREGPAFVKAPLLWKYAAGGPGTPNPLGIRHDAPPDPYGQRLVPRFQPPGIHVTGPDQVIPTIGLGPIAPTWPTRMEKLHHHAATWDHHGYWQRPLPREIEASYFNAAPLDQQVEAIRPDERIVLENLHPELTRVATNLSPVVPEAVVERPGRAPEPAPFLCDTMIIDADRGVCTLTWRARIVLDAQHALGAVRVTLANAPPEIAPAYGGSVSASAPPPAASATSGASGAAAGGASTSAWPPASGASGAVAGGGAPARAPAAPAFPPAPLGTPGARVPIDRCAAIAASIALRSGDTVAILQENQLTDEDWDEVEFYWSETLKRDASEGEPRRLAAYDRAFVARLEEERGPITPEEYARLALAQDRDRGALTRALRDMGLPWGCTPRILRVFSERIAADPKLADQIRAAMAG
ncbi:MAG: DUF2169 domain-containing protein [Minicystis sp.]